MSGVGEGIIISKMEQKRGHVALRWIVLQTVLVMLLCSVLRKLDFSSHVTLGLGVLIILSLT